VCSVSAGGIGRRSITYKIKPCWDTPSSQPGGPPSLGQPSSLRPHWVAYNGLHRQCTYNTPFTLPRLSCTHVEKRLRTCDVTKMESDSLKSQVFSIRRKCQVRLRATVMVMSLPSFSDQRRLQMSSLLKLPFGKPKNLINLL
jgi:hypothetical protein